MTDIDMAEAIERLTSQRKALAETVEQRQAEIERLRADLDLRNQTALDRKEIIAKLEAEIERLRADVRDLRFQAQSYRDEIVELLNKRRL